MKASPNRTYLFYRPGDFGLYLFSLLIPGIVGWFAFPTLVLRSLLVAALFYMALTFVLKRGAEFDRETFAVIAHGLWRYPHELLSRLWHDRRRQILAITLFVMALFAESALKRRFGDEIFWLRPFPFMKVVLGYFSFILLFRTLVFLAHLRNHATVRSVLESSEWRRELGNLGTRNHVFQAYVSGLITHASVLMPAVIFWRLTEPTYFREAALLVASLLALPWRPSLARLRRPDVGFTVPALLMNTLLLTRGAHVDAVLLRDHRRAHSERFAFTVMHGHHHDSIPSALIGGPGYGYAEGIHEELCALGFLQGTILVLTIQTIVIFFDMLAHQYIPGIPPFSRFVVQGNLHHVVHHYGSVRPLGLTGPPYQLDLDNGYNPDNRRVRWYLKLVQEHEKNIPAHLYDRFNDLRPTRYTVDPTMVPGVSGPLVAVTAEDHLEG